MEQLFLPFLEALKKKLTIFFLPIVYPSKMTAFGISQGSDKLNAAHPMGRIGAEEDLAGLMVSSFIYLRFKLKRAL